MSTTIHLNESKLMDYYEKMMDEVVLQHHTYPSNIPAWARCGPEAGLEQAMYASEALDHLEALEAQEGRRAAGRSKQVNLHSDPKYSNGLRRRRGR